MIIKIDHTLEKNASDIYSIFQSSYTVEAEMLNAIDFPPLQRSIESFMNSKTKFHAFYEFKEICGLIEIDASDVATHIQSLVVYPKYFRKGIARSLVSFALSEYQSDKFTVETGLSNLPAVSLYESMGFKETSQWDTNHGVRKIRFELLR